MGPQARLQIKDLMLVRMLLEGLTLIQTKYSICAKYVSNPVAGNPGFRLRARHVTLPETSRGENAG